VTLLSLRFRRWLGSQVRKRHCGEPEGGVGATADFRLEKTRGSVIKSLLKAPPWDAPDLSTDGHITAPSANLSWCLTKLL